MDYLFPISSADDIGASSYFLSFQGSNLIFDCGARYNATISYPQYSVLLGEHVEGFDRIDAIFLSHAHFDHIGSLAAIAAQASQAAIYATKTTKEIIKLQLIDFDRVSRKEEPLKLKKMRQLQVQKIIERIIEIPVMRPMLLNGMEITFFPAGHMAGACMVYVKKNGKSVLYTGDFSFDSFMGMNEPNFNGVHPNVLIMTGTNGFRYQIKTKLDYKNLEKHIKASLKKGRNVLIQSQSIPKHLNFFYALKMMKIPVKAYIHTSSMPIANAFSELGYHIFSDALTMDQKCPEQKHILISEFAEPGYDVIQIDCYSLHASFSDLINLVYLYMPEKVFVVHYEPELNTLCFVDDLLEQGRYHGTITMCKNMVKYEI
ncbi:MAG: MBL fold metallo-hydrolase [Clostridiales bacterium]|nr:MBL fold metallo-hydrolase [Clostridiales bacterium]